MRHGARVEGRNLIVRLIRAAEERRRELAGDFPYERGVDAGGLEPVAVLAKILPGGRHQLGPLAQKRERVGDVRRAAATTLVHGVDQKAQADAREVLGKKVLGELPRK